MDRADLFIASTDSDEINLLASLLAKGLGAKETLCFVGKGGTWRCSPTPAPPRSSAPA